MAEMETYHYTTISLPSKYVLLTLGTAQVVATHVRSQLIPSPGPALCLPCCF